MKDNIKKKIFLLVLGGLVYFGPSLFGYYVMNEKVFSGVWLAFGWVFSFLVIDYLQ